MPNVFFWRNEKALLVLLPYKMLLFAQDLLERVNQTFAFVFKLPRWIVANIYLSLHFQVRQKHDISQSLSLCCLSSPFIKFVPIWIWCGHGKRRYSNIKKTLNFTLNCSYSSHLFGLTSKVLHKRLRRQHFYPLLHETQPKLHLPAASI